MIPNPIWKIIGEYVGRRERSRIFRTYCSRAITLKSKLQIHRMIYYLCSPKGSDLFDYEEGYFWETVINIDDIDLVKNIHNKYKLRKSQISSHNIVRANACDGTTNFRILNWWIDEFKLEPLNVVYRKVEKRASYEPGIVTTHAIDCCIKNKRLDIISWLIKKFGIENEKARYILRKYEESKGILVC